jgi:hypothetical protein
MSSWFLCSCGRQIHKNLFSGAGVSLVIDEKLLDQDFAKSTARALVAEIITSSRLMLSCPECRRLHIVDESGEAPPESYVPDPGSRS